MSASEQQARDAAVRSVELAEQSLGLSRRQYVLGGVGLLVTVATGYLGVAVSKNYWPFSESDAETPDVLVSSLVAQLETAKTSTKRIAILEEIGQRSKLGHPDRQQAVAALVQFLREQPGVPTVPRDNAALGRKAPAEVNRAFTLLGKANVSYKEADLRSANLSGLESDGLDFTQGVTLFGADLTGAVITRTTIGSSNAGEANLTRTWFGACILSGLNLIDANLTGALFRSTRLSGCQLAGADLTGADFSSAQVEDCDFAGRRLVKGSQRNATWDPDNLPKWPNGFDPDSPEPASSPHPRDGHGRGRSQG